MTNTDYAARLNGAPRHEIPYLPTDHPNHSTQPSYGTQYLADFCVGFRPLRIVLFGEAIGEAVSPGSSGVYRYEATPELRESSPASISEHFPVEFGILLHEERIAHKDEL